MTAQAEGWTAGPAPTDAWTPGPASIAPDFHTSNAKDSAGQPMVVDGPSELSRITPDPERATAVANTARRLWAGLMSPGQLVPAPTAVGGSGTNHPLMPGSADEQFAPKFVRDMHAVKREADAAWEKGDHVTAAAKYIESVVPLIGPMMSGWGNEAQRHEASGIVGDLLSFLVPHGVNAVLPEAAPMRTPGARASARLTPEEHASNAFAAEHDVPLDAATATGSRALRAVQKRVANSMGGEGTAERLMRDQRTGLTRAGDQLTDAAFDSPTNVSPEVAGTRTHEMIRGHMRALQGDADTAYDALRAIEEKRGTPLDITTQKNALRPMYNDLERQAKLVPLQGDKARALVALDRLMRGPDAASLTTVDAALGDLKSLARADIPELRTQGQGAAAAAVKQLESAVQVGAARLGPEAVAALKAGRSATIAKYETGDLFERLRDEPVQVFRQLTAPKDTGIALLRQVKDVTGPEQLRAVGRAWLEDRLDSATERGAFDHADRLYADWQKLGPETKKLLFGGEHTDLVPQLDDFFLLAKRIAENPNASGTAHTLTALNVGGQPLTFALAKLLYTQRGVKALTKLLSIEAPSPGTAAAAAVKGAVKQAAVIDLANAARAAGVPWALPKAARPDRDSAK